jgi:hypothetical protein
MRYTKGKWTASYRDTWSLDQTLSPIIYAGLSRFHDVLEQKNREGKCLGVPSEYCANPDVDVTDPEVQDWLDDIKKMMYAFENKEPDIRDYDFKYNQIPYEDEITKSYEKEYGRCFTLESTNQVETDRYHADCREHEIKVQEGLNLFSKMYSSLWW